MESWKRTGIRDGKLSIIRQFDPSVGVPNLFELVRNQTEIVMNVD